MVELLAPTFPLMLLLVFPTVYFAELVSYAPGPPGVFELEAAPVILFCLYFDVFSFWELVVEVEGAWDAFPPTPPSPPTEVRKF